MKTLYHKAYLAGYLDGLRDAERGKTIASVSTDLLEFPLNAMEISTRAGNCLSASGCTCVADIVALDADTIKIMRNLGRKTASEIAEWLETHRIHTSAWSLYLYE